MQDKRITIPMIIFCSIFMLLLAKGQTIQHQDAHQLKNRTKESIIDYMNRLIKDSLIITGQHCGGGDHNQTRAYNIFFEGLYTLSGKYPALPGFEYGGLFMK